MNSASACLGAKEGLDAVGIVREFKKRAGQIAGPVIGMSVVTYFAYHAVQGDRGLIALGHLRQEVDTLQAEVLDIRAQRVDLEQKVAALRPESLDPDLLEERARKILGYGYDQDALVIYGQDPQRQNPYANTLAGRE